MGKAFRTKKLFARIDTHLVVVGARPTDCQRTKAEKFADGWARMKYICAHQVLGGLSSCVMAATIFSR